MHLIERIWTSVTYVVSFFTLSPIEGPNSLQQGPLLGPSNGLHEVAPKGPVFTPPGGSLTGPGSDFTCDYSAMVGWSACSTSDNRGCWLENSQTGQVFDINTDYEDANQTPLGIHRTYYLNIADGEKNLDGLNFVDGKFFNGSYPGPWIQACWGDVCISIF